MGQRENWPRRPKYLLLVATVHYSWYSTSSYWQLSTTVGPVPPSSGNCLLQFFSCLKKRNFEKTDVRFVLIRILRNTFFDSQDRWGERVTMTISSEQYSRKYCRKGQQEQNPYTLSEKLEYLFFSPRTCQCYFMNINNKYFGKIFSALCVDVFPELFQIFLNFDISWYMTKYSEVHLKNCLLIQYCSIS